MPGKTTERIAEKTIEYAKKKKLYLRPICAKHITFLIPEIYRAMVDVLIEQGRIDSTVLGNFKVRYRKVPKWMGDMGYMKIATFKNSPNLKRKLNK